ncbi:cellulose synthase complex periplasmic endoglucanase BcsZ [Xylophilus sp. GW821-FHT01B05]
MRTDPLHPAASRRTCLRLLLGTLLAQGPLRAGAAAARPCPEPGWPLWQAFVQYFVQPDGRVLDASTPQKHSSSEGQSYGMFFALVANDRDRFELLWRWTVDNLLGGRVEGHLPAWFWGLASDGGWRVQDDNSASDADLWIIYSLLEAARLWRRPDYERDAGLLLAEVERREVAEVPGLGAMLLPGERGFVHEEGQNEAKRRSWQFNASYQPLPVLRRLAVAAPRGPWRRIADNTLTLLRQTTPPDGFVADWVAYTVDAQGQGRFGPHPTKADVGSYDAIRTYMWAGMVPRSDPLASDLLGLVRGMSVATSAAGVPPEFVSVSSGKTRGVGPFGFSAALLPYLQATGNGAALAKQQQRVADGLLQVLAPQNAKDKQPPYYDLVLTLFGLGWLEGRYRFGRTGALEPAWETSCRATSTR